MVRNMNPSHLFSLLPPAAFQCHRACPCLARGMRMCPFIIEKAYTGPVSVIPYADLLSDNKITSNLNSLLLEILVFLSSLICRWLCEALIHISFP